jgi:hypothetical protein
MKSCVRFEVFTAVTMENGVFWDVTPCGSCKSRRFEELSASFIRMTRNGELGTTLASRCNIPEDTILQMRSYLEEKIAAPV